MLRLLSLLLCSAVAIAALLFLSTPDRPGANEPTDAPDANEPAEWAPDRWSKPPVTNAALPALAMVERRILFVESSGLAGNDVRFHTEGYVHTVSFLDDRIVLRRWLSGGGSETIEQILPAGGERSVEGFGSTKTRANYYRGQARHGWRSGLTVYGGVRYRGLYPGIDLEFSESDGRLKSEYVVSPGADASAIRLKYDGVRDISLRDDGALVIETDYGKLVEQAPFSYQIIDGEAVTVPARYHLGNSRTTGEIAIEVGPYDPGIELIIDPEIVYASFVSGPQGSSISGVAALDDGTLIVAGSTGDPAFPTDVVPGGQTGGSFEMFLAKIDADQTDYVWLTFLGGPSFDLSRAMTADGEEKIYLTGATTGGGFPLLNPIQDAYAGGTWDGILATFNADGELLTSTYLGGDADDTPQDVELGSGGEIVLTGYTDATNFPEVGALQAGNQGDDDVFVTVIDPSATEILFSTLLGGSNRDRLFDSAVTPDDKIVLVGETASADFPTVNPFFGSLNGPSDAFITTLSGELSDAALKSFSNPEIEQSGFFGGQGNERLASVDFHAATGFTYLGGITNSDMIVTPVATSTGFGGIDGFILGIDNDGQIIQFEQDGADGSDFIDLVVPLGNGRVAAGAEFSTGSGVSGLWIYDLGDQVPGPSEMVSSGDMLMLFADRMPINQTPIFSETIDLALSGPAQEMETTQTAIQPEGSHECPEGSPDCRSNGALIIVRIELPIVGGTVTYDQAANQIEGFRLNVCPDSPDASWSFLRTVPLNKGDEISWQGGEPGGFVLDASSWLGMVQCVPDIPYGQPTIVITIPMDPSAGESRETRTDAPIRVNGSDLWGGYEERLNSTDRLDPNPSTILEISDNETISQAEDEPAAGPRVCAVIVRGDVDNETEEEAYENSVSMFKQNITSEALGPKIPESAITEMRSPTVEEFRNTMMSLRDQCDTSYFYYAGHGWPNGVEVTDSETLTWSEISVQLYASNAQTLNVILDACHSGSAKEPFTRDGRFERRNVTLVTAAAADKQGYGHDDADELGGGSHYVLSFTYWLMRGFGNPAADLDGDGQTSLSESFHWLREQNPVVKTPDLFINTGRMNEFSDPQMLNSQTKPATGDRISFEDAGVEVSQTSALEPGVELQVATISGLGGDDRDETSVIALSEGRHWTIEAEGQTAPFEMDIAFKYDPVVDFELGAGEVPGLAVRPLQNTGTGKAAAEPWTAYLPTFWDAETRTVVARGVTTFQEWALALTEGAEVVAIEAENGIPEQIGFDPAFPNPFANNTNLAYWLSEPTYVRISVFDLEGRIVATLLDQQRPAGRHIITWDGTPDQIRGGLSRNGGLSSGTYLVRLEAGSFRQTRTVTLVR